MKLKKENWFNENGYKLDGYEQIRNRMIFLEKEYKNLNDDEKKHEIDILKNFIEMIILLPTKDFYSNKLEILLNKNLV